jgi:phage terminase large subunit-like protein
MCTWIPGVSGKSPDRVDALVWALTDLMLDGVAFGGGDGVFITYSSRR